MAELTPKAFATKLRGKIALIQKENLPLKIAAQTVHTLRVLRIFHKGISPEGGNIRPPYNKSKALYVPNDELRRATNRGKTGKPIGTSYFKSYYDLKKNQGFNPNVVNSRLTNNLQSDFANQNLSASSDNVPSNAAPIKITVDHYVERLDRPENIKKFKGLTRKYNRPFSFSKKERDTFEKVFTYEMNRLLNV